MWFFRKRWTVPIVATVLLLSFGFMERHVFAGGITPFGVHMSSVKPDTLLVIRQNPLKQPRVEPLTQVVSDQATVQKLYLQVGNFRPPLIDNGTINCPMNNGVSYDLHFLHGQTKVLDVDVNASGCREIYAVRENGDKKFLARLDKAADFQDLMMNTLKLSVPDYIGVYQP